MNDNLPPDFPITDATDVAILMHRDAHFGGRFDVMLDYYTKEGKGVNPEFDFSRIGTLAHLEQRIQQNLAAILLSGADAERVAEARDKYKKLRDLYEHKRKKASKHAILIADLILSEEEMPDKEIDAIIAEKGAIVPALIELLQTEDFYDPLFPGYGLAPALAVHCLGKIGDKRAIIALFESIGDSDFFNEDLALEALRQIGDPAKEFLLKVVHGRPINADNERAAIALSQFKDDPQVTQTCLNMLKEIDLKKHIVLAEYLILACEGLDTDQRAELLELANRSTTPSSLRQDMQIIAKL